MPLTLHHPRVVARSLALAVGYEDAEAIVRASRDPADVQAVREIDAARTQARAEALAINTDMADRLGLTLDESAELVRRLAGDSALWTWLGRRVQLTLAHESPVPHDEHPENG